MPRVREAHWRPGEWPRPVCPGPGEDEACGAPVSYYKPPGGEEAHEIDWTPDKPVMAQPCAHILPATALGVVAFRRPPRDPDDLPRVTDGAQMYLSQYR